MTSGLISELLFVCASLLAVSVVMHILTWKRLRKGHFPRPARWELERRAEQSGVGLTVALADQARARVEQTRAENARAEQARFERARATRARADRQRLGRELRAEQAQLVRSERLRSAHFLLAIAVQVLPPSERDRYLEEFRAELLDVQRDARLRHARSLLRGVIVLRLHREQTKQGGRRRGEEGERPALRETHM